MSRSERKQKKKKEAVAESLDSGVPGQVKRQRFYYVVYGETFPDSQISITGEGRYTASERFEVVLLLLRLQEVSFSSFL